jgi:hypothetical protein
MKKFVPCFRSAAAAKWRENNHSGAKSGKIPDLAKYLRLWLLPRFVVKTSLLSGKNSTEIVFEKIGLVG